NNLEKVLLDISSGLEKRTMRQLELFVRLLEPMMLLVMAGLTLVVVAGLLLPVFKMSSAVSLAGGPAGLTRAGSWVFNPPPCYSEPARRRRRPWAHKDPCHDPPHQSHAPDGDPQRLHADGNADRGRHHRHRRRHRHRRALAAAPEVQGERGAHQGGADRE